MVLLKCTRGTRGNKGSRDGVHRTPTHGLNYPVVAHPVAYTRVRVREGVCLRFSLEGVGVGRWVFVNACVCVRVCVCVCV